MKTYRCLALVALIVGVTSLLAGCGGGGGGGGANPVAATDTTGTTGTTGTTTAADLAAVSSFTKQVDQFVVSYQNYKPYFGATDASAFAANIKGSVAGGVRSWTWEPNYGYYWFYYIPGYMDAGSSLLLVFYDDAYNHYPYLSSSPLITKLGAGSIIKYYEGSSLVSLSESYIFDGIKNPSLVSVTGSAEGSVNNVRIVRLDLNQVVVNTNNPYPVSGTLQMNVSGQGTASITFNGTNIVTLSALMTNGETKSVKYDLANAKALASRRPFEK